MDDRTAQGTAIDTDALEILQLDRFDTAFAVSPDRDAATKRRFMTLFVESSRARNYGSSGYVARARNAKGEVFAVKRLRIDGDKTPIPGEERPRASAAQVAAFREEYRSQLLISHMKGFPRLYGLGEMDGQPVIIMEWIEGETLDSIKGMLPRGAKPNSIAPNTVACIGRCLFSILEGLDRLAERPVHRDLSPSNIMIRTDKATVAEQISCGEFDLCLIDFGSATVLDTIDPRFTMLTDVWRNGTPEYAPPEMLTHDVPNIEHLRQSPSIDVYASCSILYELLSGHTPFRISEQSCPSPYRLKMELNPTPIDAAFGPLAQAINQGLERNQRARITAGEARMLCERYLGMDAQTPFAPAPVAQGQVPPLADFEVAHLSMPTFAPVPQAPTPTAPDERPLKPEKNHPSRRTFIIGALGAVGAAAAIGAIAYFSGSHAPEESNDGNNEPINGNAGSGSDTGTASTATVPYTGGTLLLAQDTETRLWGYLNSKREWVIAPRFTETPGFFSEGLAFAKDPDTGLFGFIDYEGTWAIEPKYTTASTFTESGLAVAVSSARSAVSGLETNRLGWIDNTGTWVIDPIYESGGAFHQGLATFSRNAATSNQPRWGYMDPSGITVIPEEYRDAKAFADNGLAAAAESLHMWGWIDEDGNWKIEPTAYADVSSFHEGFAAVCDAIDNMWLYIDEQGAPAIADIQENAAGTAVLGRFADARSFSDGRAAVKDAASGLWGYIDSTGAWLTRPKFGRLGEFAHGLAPAQDASSGLFGYIDDQAQWVIEPQFLAVGLAALE